MSCKAWRTLGTVLTGSGKNVTIEAEDDGASFQCDTPNGVYIENVGSRGTGRRNMGELARRRRELARKGIKEMKRDEKESKERDDNGDIIIHDPENDAVDSHKNDVISNVEEGLDGKRQGEDNGEEKKQQKDGDDKTDDEKEEEEDDDDDDDDDNNGNDDDKHEMVRAKTKFQEGFVTSNLVRAINETNFNDDPAHDVMTFYLENKRGVVCYELKSYDGLQTLGFIKQHNSVLKKKVSQ
jgi:hypothetical protein